MGSLLNQHVLVLLHHLAPSSRRSAGSTGKEIKLSEMFTVYWEFVEKVREFARTKGASLVDKGSESEAVLLRWKQYGIVREADYTGTVGGQTIPNHGPLFDEIRAYLDFLRKKHSSFTLRFGTHI
jgi:bleomycin hydrolase